MLEKLDTHSPEQLLLQYDTLKMHKLQMLAFPSGLYRPAQIEDYSINTLALEKHPLA